MAATSNSTLRNIFLVAGILLMLALFFAGYAIWGVALLIVLLAMRGGALAIEQVAPGVGVVQASEDVEQRGLARAGGADDGDDVAPVVGHDELDHDLERGVGQKGAQFAQRGEKGVDEVGEPGRGEALAKGLAAELARSV